MNERIFELLGRVNRKNIWDEEPVFCFTTDIDWASEAVLRRFFRQIPFEAIKLTAFVTHRSEIISGMAAAGMLERGIHPNFLPNSSHGNDFKEIVENCLQFAPEAIGFRSHRLFDVTDITHLLANNYHFKYVSNLGTTMASHIRPVLHESQLVHYPIFFEDGSHLYNELGLSIKPFADYFSSPGIKIISFHPVNVVLNGPYIKYIREIKDTLTREEYVNISEETILQSRNNGPGIGDTVAEIIDFVFKNNYKILSMNELYHQTISPSL